VAGSASYGAKNATGATATGSLELKGAMNGVVSKDGSVAVVAVQSSHATVPTPTK